MISAVNVADPLVGPAIGSGALPEVKFRLERLFGEGGTALAHLATRFGPDGTSTVVVQAILPRIIAQGGESARMIVQEEAVALVLCFVLSGQPCFETKSFGR